MTIERDYYTFNAGDVVLQSGRTFPAMQLAYTTYGTLNADRSNVIVYPTSYSAQHYDTQWLVGDGKILDTSRYFVIIPNLFGNGLSSSPSNTGWPLKGDRYPNVTLQDAVLVQERMLRETFGVERVKLVYGWSMGAMQAYHWAGLFGKRVERIAVVCGAAKCSAHNAVFIEAVRATLTADPAWRDGVFHEKPVRGLRAMGRVYAALALSQEFYREEMWRDVGYSSLEDYLVRHWEVTFARRDAGDLLAQLWTWQHGDISNTEQFAGNLPKALEAITARVLLMPGDHDLYFRVEDNAREFAYLKHARLAPISSVWGHRAGNPVLAPREAEFIRAAVWKLLEE
jgi:homoserine O-acetyltransferase